jgi:hypothetical protein
MVAKYSIPFGQRFGSLVLLAEAPMRNKYHRRVYAQCDCGNLADVGLPEIKNGKTQSCGCGRVQHAHASGGKTSRTYSTWRAMKARCLNPKHPGYAEYGGRGIAICQQWIDSFENFLTDMGERPARMTLDRFPDVNGNYQPGNCRWATVRDQQNNRRFTVIIEHRGIKKALTEWADEIGITSESLYKRIQVYGWSPEKALETPNRKYVRK